MKSRYNIPLLLGTGRKALVANVIACLIRGANEGVVIQQRGTLEKLRGRWTVRRCLPHGIYALDMHRSRQGESNLNTRMSAGKELGVSIEGESFDQHGDDQRAMSSMMEPV